MSINKLMNQYFLKLPKLEVNYFTDYFLNYYIPKYNILENILNSHTPYIEDHLIHQKYESIKLLERYLKEEYNFLYDIQYFIIFYHTGKQNIHIDGKETYRYASLNLPLSGYEGSKTIFYTLKNSNNFDRDRITDAHYYNEDNLEKVAEIEGTNEWALVNSGVPHHVVSTIETNHRITLCVRFKHNPKFETVSKILSSA